MSKGDRKREAAIARRVEEERQAQLRQKKRRRNRIVTVCVAVVAAGGILAGTLAYTNYKKVTAPDYVQHHTVVASSDHHEVTQAMLTYFVQSTVMNFTNQYSDYLDQMGLDTNQTLSGQLCYFDKSMSWLQYFLNSTKETVNWMLGFSEQAAADGLTLDDADREAIEKTLANVKPADFGAYVTKDDIRACLELYYLADKQETSVQSTLTCTDEEAEAYCAENARDFLVADYASYTLNFGDGKAYADEETALALADRLMQGTAADFEAAVKAELVAQKVYTEETVEGGYDKDQVIEKYSYTTDDGFSDWLFSGTAQAGDAYKVKGTGSYTVYRALTTPARDMSKAVNVRHILLTSATYGSDDAAAAKADELLAEWKAGEATEESFGELAKVYTEDSNKSAGGLYTGVTEGQMVQTFNDWCFDAARVSGDTGVVKTDYGYHVMYFVGADAAWRVAAQQSVLDARYNALYDGYLTTYHATFDDTAAQQLEL